jgi:hypothetical protein
LLLSLLLVSNLTRKEGQRGAVGLA